VTLSVLLSGQLLTSVLVLASLYALVAIGLNLVYGTMRLLNVAR
jgi:branched-chain amino acid transport system permease protein